MYKTDDLGNIKRLSDGAAIPRDTKNRDYADFLAWQAKGNVAVATAAIVRGPSLQEQIDALRADVDALRAGGVKGGK